MNKTSIILSLGILIIAGVILFLTTYRVEQVNAGSNVTYSGDKQIIALTAKGGFSPASTVAKSGMPTTIKITTNGTFDCSSSLVIPALNFEKTLPATGITDVEIPAQESGTTINGTCSMGMYSFSVKFE